MPLICITTAGEQAYSQQTSWSVHWHLFVAPNINKLWLSLMCCHFHRMIGGRDFRFTVHLHAEQMVKKETQFVIF